MSRQGRNPKKLNEVKGKVLHLSKNGPRKQPSLGAVQLGIRALLGRIWGPAGHHLGFTAALEHQELLEGPPVRPRSQWQSHIGPCRHTAGSWGKAELGVALQPMGPLKQFLLEFLAYLEIFAGFHTGNAVSSWTCPGVQPYMGL